MNEKHNQEKVLERKKEKVALGLYKLISNYENKELNSKIIENFLAQKTLDEDTRKRFLFWKDEFKFWEDYARVYHHMEDTSFYAELIEAVKEFIGPKEGEIWLDAGCGPARISQLIWEKSQGKVKKIVATDIVLKPARETLIRLGESIPLELKYANMGERLPFPDNFFDGIAANLCLTYVIDFKGKRGREAFTEVMREMFRVLRPGGHIVWSTPKRNPFFLKNFLVGLPDMFSIKKQIRHRVFGPWIGIKILIYGLGIALKGKKGVYTFLTPEEYEKILKKIGFVNLKWRKAFAGQVWVNRSEKPNIIKGL